MRPVSVELANQIRIIREFNRFYTARLGLLRKRHLNGEFSLTEARVLYEISSNPGITASRLREILLLDRGYISRLLSALTRRKLVREAASSSDAREKLLTLTTAGDQAVAHLNESSDRQMSNLLAAIDPQHRDALTESIQRVHGILAGAGSGAVSIHRLTEPSAEALSILEEYYEAVHVVKRDDPAALHSLLAELNSAMWLAKLGGEVIGCVVLRELSSVPRAGECKRLYVRPAARGRHVASMLLDALESHARDQRLEWVYLDTYDDLRPAIALYEQRGYERCDRYNDNPQATLFMRKRL